MARVLLTGASGFAGPPAIAALREAGFTVRLALRRAVDLAPDVETVPIGDLSRPVDWRDALADVDHVVHLAGLAHAGAGLDEELYRRINTEATLRLAEAAETAGIRRFVFISSIKALTGESEGRFRDKDEPRPTDAYGRSKLAAEQGLAQLGLDWVALRPVLIYGPGVKANMAALLKLAKLPVPLPLGGLTEPRSLLSVENLAGAILFALSPDCPARRSYIVSDLEPVSVARMLAELRAGMGRDPGLLPVPPAILRRAARLLGKGEAYRKLAGGLVAQPDTLLSSGWQPVLSVKEGLRRLGASVRGA